MATLLAEAGSAQTAANDHLLSVLREAGLTRAPDTQKFADEFDASFAEALEKDMEAVDRARAAAGGESRVFQMPPPPGPLLGGFCNVCGKTKAKDGVTPFGCPECKLEFYCSTKCQRVAAARHAPVCKQVASEHIREVVDTFQFVGENFETLLSGMLDARAGAPGAKPRDDPIERDMRPKVGALSYLFNMGIRLADEVTAMEYVFINDPAILTSQRYHAEVSIPYYKKRVEMETCLEMLYSLVDPSGVAEKERVWRALSDAERTAAARKQHIVREFDKAYYTLLPDIIAKYAAEAKRGSPESTMTVEDVTELLPLEHHHPTRVQNGFRALADHLGSLSQTDLTELHTFFFTELGGGGGTPAEVAHRWAVLGGQRRRQSVSGGGGGGSAGKSMIVQNLWDKIVEFIGTKWLIIGITVIVTLIFNLIVGPLAVKQTANQLLQHVDRTQGNVNLVRANTDGIIYSADTTIAKWEGGADDVNIMDAVLATPRTGTFVDRTSTSLAFKKTTMEAVTSSFGLAPWFSMEGIDIHAAAVHSPLTNGKTVVYPSWWSTMIWGDSGLFTSVQATMQALFKFAKAPYVTSGRSQLAVLANANLGDASLRLVTINASCLNQRAFFTHLAFSVMMRAATSDADMITAFLRAELFTALQPEHTPANGEEREYTLRRYTLVDVKNALLTPVPGAPQPAWTDKHEMAKVAEMVMIDAYLREAARYVNDPTDVIEVFITMYLRGGFNVEIREQGGKYGAGGKAGLDAVNTALINFMKSLEKNAMKRIGEMSLSDQFLGQIDTDLLSVAIRYWANYRKSAHAYNVIQSAHSGRAGPVQRFLFKLITVNRRVKPSNEVRAHALPLDYMEATDAMHWLHNNMTLVNMTMAGTHMMTNMFIVGANEGFLQSLFVPVQYFAPWITTAAIALHPWASIGAWLGLQATNFVLDGTYYGYALDAITPSWSTSMWVISALYVAPYLLSKLSSRITNLRWSPAIATGALVLSFTGHVVIEALVANPGADWKAAILQSLLRTGIQMATLVTARTWLFAPPEDDRNQPAFPERLQPRMRALAGAAGPSRAPHSEDATEATTDEPAPSSAKPEAPTSRAAALDFEQNYVGLMGELHGTAGSGWKVDAHAAEKHVLDIRRASRALATRLADVLLSEDGVREGDLTSEAAALESALAVLVRTFSRPCFGHTPSQTPPMEQTLHGQLLGQFADAVVASVEREREDATTQYGTFSVPPPVRFEGRHGREEKKDKKKKRGKGKGKEKERDRERATDTDTESEAPARGGGAFDFFKRVRHSALGLWYTSAVLLNVVTTPAAATVGPDGIDRVWWTPEAAAKITNERVLADHIALYGEPVDPSLAAQLTATAAAALVTTKEVLTNVKDIFNPSAAPEPTFVEAAGAGLMAAGAHVMDAGAWLGSFVPWRGPSRPVTPPPGFFDFLGGGAGGGGLPLLATSKRYVDMLLRAPIQSHLLQWVHARTRDSLSPRKRAALRLFILEMLPDVITCAAYATFARSFLEPAAAGQELGMILFGGPVVLRLIGNLMTFATQRSAAVVDPDFALDAIMMNNRHDMGRVSATFLHHMADHMSLFAPLAMASFVDSEAGLAGSVLARYALSGALTALGMWITRRAEPNDSRLFPSQRYRVTDRVARVTSLLPLIPLVHDASAYVDVLFATALSMCNPWAPTRTLQAGVAAAHVMWILLRSAGGGVGFDGTATDFAAFMAHTLFGVAQNSLPQIQIVSAATARRLMARVRGIPGVTPQAQEHIQEALAAFLDSALTEGEEHWTQFISSSARSLSMTS